MLIIQDCIDNCRVTEEEIEAVDEQNLTPGIVASEIKQYLCISGGERCLCDKVVDDIRAVRKSGDLRQAATLRLALQFVLECGAGVALTEEQKHITHADLSMPPAFGESLLLTHFYQLNMLQAYHDASMDRTAVFEFFVRRLPEHRGFLLAVGLTSVIAFLGHARFNEEDLSWLRESGRFDPGFVESLADWRFSGDVDAIDEGRVFFLKEPILRVSAPISQAQLVESRVINLLHFQTVIASKAAGFVLAAPGKTLIDFGLRRAYGAKAGFLAAQCAYLSGFTGSARTLAEKRFGVPAYGTKTHSSIQAHDSEEAAFDHFGKSRPEHARTVRAILDAGGLDDVRIFASGGLDENRLTSYVADDVPIDGCGIGTNLTTSEDAPALDCAYKLQEYDGRPKRKRSEGKATWPGRKQVYRRYGSDGLMTDDFLTPADCSDVGEPLLRPILRAGARSDPLPTLEEARHLAADELARLPQHLRALKAKPVFPVRVAPELRKLAVALDQDTV